MHVIYQQENIDDLQRFFDKYMLDKGNGWENTPNVRYSLLGYNRPSIVNQPAAEYPPAKFNCETFYLDATRRTLELDKPSVDNFVEYHADSPFDEGFSFIHTSQEYTELCGISKVKLHMSTLDHDDMDIYVVLRKLDKDNKGLCHQNIPMRDLTHGTEAEDIPNENVWRDIGPNGRLLASHRALTEEQLEGLDHDVYIQLIGPAYAYHPYSSPEKLRHGEIVDLEISLWPGGMIFDAGESMSLQIMGRNPILSEFKG